MIKEKLEKIAEKFNTLFVNKEFYFFGGIYDKNNTLREGYNYAFTPSNWFVVEVANMDGGKRFALMMRDEEGNTRRPITLLEKINPAIYEYNCDDHSSSVFIHHDEGRFEFMIEFFSKENMALVRR